MGSEIIIPGTPIGDIPAYDRPNFDPKAQNGYLGSIANLAAPPPGTNVQRYTLAKTGVGVTFTGGLAKSQAGTLTLAAGASATIRSAFSSPNAQWIQDVMIFVEGANTTNPVQIQGGDSGHFADLPSGVAVVLPRLDTNGPFSGAVIKNNDTVARTISLFATIGPGIYTPSNEYAIGLGSIGLNQVNLQDVLRVRDLTVILSDNSGTPLAPWCAAAILPNGIIGGVTQTTAGRRFRLRGLSVGAGEGGGANNGGNGWGHYALDAPVDILGTDYATQAWSNPTLFLTFFGLANLNEGITVNLFGLFDLYVGANQ